MDRTHPTKASDDIGGLTVTLPAHDDRGDLIALKGAGDENGYARTAFFGPPNEEQNKHQRRE